MIYNEGKDLILSPESEGQILVGLSWDPNTEKVGFMKKLSGVVGENHETYDLDISCYMYDEGKAFMDYVTGESGETIDKSGFIRHSGDARHGRAEGDDEFIICELKKLPPYIKEIFFIVEVGSAHSFAEIAAPETRIADYGTNENVLHTAIGRVDDADYSAYVFAKLTREKENNWKLYHVDHYVDHEEIEDWSDYLTNFIKD